MPKTRVAKILGGQLPPPNGRRGSLASGVGSIPFSFRHGCRVLDRARRACTPCRPSRPGPRAGCRLIRAVGSPSTTIRSARLPGRSSRELLVVLHHSGPQAEGFRDPEHLRKRGDPGPDVELELPWCAGKTRRASRSRPRSGTPARWRGCATMRASMAFERLAVSARPSPGGQADRRRGTACVRSVAATSATGPLHRPLRSCRGGFGEEPFKDAERGVDHRLALFQQPDEPLDPLRIQVELSRMAGPPP